MTPFQWLALSFLAVVLVWELIAFWRGPVRRGPWLFRCLVWMAAGVAIAFPGRVQALANAIGINRGADLVFYLFVLASLVVSFYFYSRYVQLQRQITQLVRHIAIQEARRGAHDKPNIENCGDS